MTDIENISTMFTGRIELQDGQPMIEIPEREVNLGVLQPGETYKIAVFPSVSSSAETEDSVQHIQDLPQEDASGAPVEEGELIEVEVEDIGDKGDGIARVGPGFIVFIPGAEVGDRVTAEVEQVRDSFAFAEVIEGEPVNSTSTSRTVN